MPVTSRCGRGSGLPVATPVAVVNQLWVGVQQQGDLQLASVHVLAGGRAQPRGRPSNIPICEVVESATEVAGELVWGATKTYERRRVRLPRFLCEQLGAHLGSRPHAAGRAATSRSASITLDRYGHLLPEELDHLADRLDRLHAQAAVYPACTDAPVSALGQGKGPGR
jgi:hypothetical protein